MLRRGKLLRVVVLLEESRRRLALGGGHGVVDYTLFSWVLWHSEYAGWGEILVCVMVGETLVCMMESCSGRALSQLCIPRRESRSSTRSAFPSGKNSPENEDRKAAEAWASSRDGVGAENLVLQLYDAVEQFFFFSSRRRHTRFDCDWIQTCALPI